MELMADSVAKNGMDYQQRYSWVMRFDEQGIIVEVGVCGRGWTTHSLERWQSADSRGIGASVSGLGIGAEGDRCQRLIAQGVRYCTADFVFVAIKFTHSHTATQISVRNAVVPGPEKPNILPRSFVSISLLGV